MIIRLHARPTHEARPGDSRAVRRMDGPTTRARSGVARVSSPRRVRARWWPVLSRVGHLCAIAPSGLETRPACVAGPVLGPSPFGTRPTPSARGCREATARPRPSRDRACRRERASRPRPVRRASHAARVGQAASARARVDRRASTVRVIGHPWSYLEERSITARARNPTDSARCVRRCSGGR
jgi:hypothetical protein